MIRYIFILCSFACLVSANPLAKLLLQSRSNCNLNGYNNAFNLPTQPNNIQSFIQQNMNQNPVSYCPCNQPYGSQNGNSVSPEDSNKSFINKLLSNPMFQSILDQNAINFNPNNNYGSKTNGQTPNIVNNYYIIPPECLQGNDKGIEMVKNLIEQKAVVCKNGENHKSAGNERNHNQRPQSKQNLETSKPKSNDKSVQNNDGSQRNSKKIKNQRNQSSNHNNANQRNNSNNRNQSKNNKQSNKNQGVNPERRPIKHNTATDRIPPIKNGSKKDKSNRNQAVKNTLKANDTTIKHYTSSKSNNTKSSNETPIKKKNETLVLNHPRDEAVITDIHKKFPGIPKDVIRRLLTYLRRQHTLQQICQDSYLKSSSEVNIKASMKKTQKKRKNLRTNSVDSLTTTQKPLNTTTENIFNVDNQTPTIAIKVVPSTDMISIEAELNSTEINEQVPTVNNKPDKEIIEITTSKTKPTSKQMEPNTAFDLEHEVNDYYPDFRFDKMYMSEDDYVRSLKNDKFYYTTDRNNYNVEESSEIFYKPYKPATSVIQVNNHQTNDKEIHSDEIEDTLTKPMEDYENYDEQINDFSNEEPDFQTPPLLEHPDFETKPILTYFDKERPVYSYQESKNVDNFNDKASTYSTAKSINTPLKDKKRSDDIETVFAGSKVAKYGQPIADAFDNDDNSNTVVVFAKSMHTT